MGKKKSNVRRSVREDADNSDEDDLVPAKARATSVSFAQLESDDHGSEEDDGHRKSSGKKTVAFSAIADDEDNIDEGGESDGSAEPKATKSAAFGALVADGESEGGRPEETVNSSRKARPATPKKGAFALIASDSSSEEETVKRPLNKKKKAASAPKKGAFALMASDSSSSEGESSPAARQKKAKAAPPKENTFADMAESSPSEEESNDREPDSLSVAKEAHSDKPTAFVTAPDTGTTSKAPDAVSSAKQKAKTKKGAFAAMASDSSSDDEENVAPVAVKVSKKKKAAAKPPAKKGTFALMASDSSDDDDGGARRTRSEAAAREVDNGESAFATMSVEDEASAPASAPAKSAKEKKVAIRGKSRPKGAAATDAAQEEEGEVGSSRVRGTTALVKQREREKKLEKEREVDDILAELEQGSGAAAKQAPTVSAAADSPPAAADAPEATDGKKGKKNKKKKKQEQDEDDIEKLLAQISAENNKIDLAMEASSAMPTEPSANGALEAIKSPSPVESKSADTAVPGDAVDSGGERADDAPVSAAQKRRQKKKAAAVKAKKDARDELNDNESAVEGAAVPAAVNEPQTQGGTSGAPKKKQSAMSRKIKATLERQQQEAEAARLEAEEKARKEEEERQRHEEQQRKKEEESRRQKEDAKLRREEKRKAGLILSKKEQERRRKNDAFKKDLIAKGMLPEALAGDKQGEKKEKVVYNTRKKPRGKAGGSEMAGGSQLLPTQAKDGESGAQTATPASDIKAEVVTQQEIASPVTPAEGNVETDDIVSSDREKATTSAAEPVAANWEELASAPKLDELQTRADSKEEAEVGEVSSAEKQTKQNLEQIAEGATSDVKAAEGKAAAKEEVDEEAEESDGSDEEDSDSEEDSDEDEDEEDDGETDIIRVRKRRLQHQVELMAKRSPKNLRAPIVCILGHVDTGKTKILDKIRRTNVQLGEAGGITQQIGATFFPIEAVKKEASKLTDDNISYDLPALLIIDTPGHESFTNLRSRGSGLCDIAILVVDIMHGLEPQTLESIELLKQRKTPFVIALNKIDRMFGWEAHPDRPTRETLGEQEAHVRDEFRQRFQETTLRFNELGFNVALYWENPDFRNYVSIVPTSAVTGEGMPDLLYLLVKLSQSMLRPRLMYSEVLQCTVLEVKVIEGFGCTVDVVLTGGRMREGDTIVLCGLDGPIVSHVRALLTPHPMREMRVKGQYLHHKELQAAQGVKIAGEGLDKTVAGTQALVTLYNTPAEIEFLKREVMKDFSTILKSVNRSGEGVYVQASTLGSLEALLEFLRTSKIPVANINIGPVFRRDVMMASTMLERRKQYACIMAFDVKVENEARELAHELGVRIFTADIIYHLFDQFTRYMEEVRRQKRDAASNEVVFPAIIKIFPQYVFNKKDPIIVGVEVVDGILKTMTPLVAFTTMNGKEQWLDIGTVQSIELNAKPVKSARRGENVAIKIQSRTTENIMYGRHFDHTSNIVSKMSRHAIDLLKENFRDDLEREDWMCVIKIKKLLGIE